MNHLSDEDVVMGSLDQRLQAATSGCVIDFSINREDNKIIAIVTIDQNSETYEFTDPNVTLRESLILLGFENPSINYQTFNMNADNCLDSPFHRIPVGQIYFDAD